MPQISHSTVDVAFALPIAAWFGTPSSVPDAMHIGWPSWPTYVDAASLTAVIFFALLVGVACA
jgi:hypothetical protein